MKLMHEKSIYREQVQAYFVSLGGNDDEQVYG